MATINRMEIRRAIGYDIKGPLPGGLNVQTGIAFTTTTITDPSLVAGQGEPVGRWLVLNGHIAVVTAFDVETMELTFSPAIPEAPEGATEYELWDQHYSPHGVNTLINQAILKAQTNGVFKPVTIDTAYQAPYTNRIPVPDDWQVLVGIDMALEDHYNYRSLIPALTLDDDVESDDETFPFHTLVLNGNRSFSMDSKDNLGMYDSVGWEVAGEFNGKTGEFRDWGFVRQDFNPHTVERNADDYPVITYSAGEQTFVLNAYLYRESDVTWLPVGFTLWQGYQQIELGDQGSAFSAYEGTRLRMHGGAGLPLLDSDDDIPYVSESYLKSQVVVSMLRAVSDVVIGERALPVRREWTLTAEAEYAQLPRMQSVWYLK